LLIIPGASHTDLYDQVDIIPFDKIEEFIRSNIVIILVLFVEGRLRLGTAIKDIREL